MTARLTTSSDGWSFGFVIVAYRPRSLRWKLATDTLEQDLIASQLRVRTVVNDCPEGLGDRVREDTFPLSFEEPPMPRSEIHGRATIRSRALRSDDGGYYLKDSETNFQPFGITVEGTTSVLIARVKPTLGRKKIA